MRAPYVYDVTLPATFRVRGWDDVDAVECLLALKVPFKIAGTSEHGSIELRAIKVEGPADVQDAVDEHQCEKDAACVLPKGHTIACHHFLIKRLEPIFFDAGL